MERTEISVFFLTFFVLVGVKILHFYKIKYAVALLTMMGNRMAQGSSQYHLRFRPWDARLPTETVLEACPSLYLVDREDYSAEVSKGLASAWKAARETIQETEAAVRQKGGQTTLFGGSTGNGLHAEQGQGQEAEASPFLP